MIVCTEEVVLCPDRAAETDWVMEGVRAVMIWDTSSDSVAWVEEELENCWDCWSNWACLACWACRDCCWLVLLWDEARAASTAAVMEGPSCDSTDSTTAVSPVWR